MTQRNSSIFFFIFCIFICLSGTVLLYFVHYLFSSVFLVFQGQKTNRSLLFSWLDQQVFDLLFEN